MAQLDPIKSQDDRCTTGAALNLTDFAQDLGVAMYDLFLSQRNILGYLGDNGLPRFVFLRIDCVRQNYRNNRARRNHVLGARTAGESGHFSQGQKSQAANEMTNGILLSHEPPFR